MVNKRTHETVPVRHTIITMYLCDDQDRLVVQLYDKHEIPEQKSGGTIVLKWHLPSAKDINLSVKSVLRETTTQRPIMTANQKRYKIVWEASYAAKQPGKRFDEKGESVFFTIEATEPENKRGDSLRVLTDSLLIVTLFNFIL